MVLFNYGIREITAKIVYYGPGLCGKTTNLQWIHEQLDPSSRGKLLSLATDGDRTLFFDFLPIEMGNIGGYKVRFQLYTVPGQVHYNATRKLVLKGVDAVAFVADSQVTMFERNRESYENLVENLVENGYDPAKVPVVIQLNKRDLPNVGTPEDLLSSMGVTGLPALEAVAARGEGVFETLKTVVKLTLTRLRSQFDADAAGGAEAPAASAPKPPPPPPSGVFSRPPAAPAPPAPAPPAPAAEAAPAEAVEEFDLEEFGEPAAAPEAAAAEPGPEGVEGTEGTEGTTEAEEGVLDLGKHHEIEVPPDATLADAEDEEARRAFFDEFAGIAEEAVAEDEQLPGEEFPDGEPLWAPATAPAAGPAAAPAEGEPAWAAELRAEVGRLREENRRLREALAGFAGALDRQVEALREARGALDRLGDGAEPGAGGEGA